MTLPASKAKALPSQADSAPASAREPKSGVPSPVLVVDDDPLCLELLNRALSREGFRFTTARNGDEALRLARSLRPTVILLDVVMPGLDGWGVLRILKADPALKSIPVIMITTVDERSKGLALGVSEYLLKPLDRQRLTALLKKYGAHSVADQGGQP